MKVTVLLKSSGATPSEFALEPSSVVLLNLETGDARPVKLADAETQIKNQNNAMLRVPAASERQAACYLAFNLPENPAVQYELADQYVQEGSLISQSSWDGRREAKTPLQIPRARAARINFPSLTLTVSWEK